MFEEFIPFIDFITFLSSAISLLLIFAYRKHPMKTGSKLILTILILLVLFHSISNLLEWTGISPVLDPFEDVLQVMEPLFWGFLFYSFLQGLKQRELMESELRLKREKEISTLLLDLMTHDLINYNTVALANLELIIAIMKSDPKSLNELKFSRLLSVSYQAILENTMLVDNVKVLHLLSENNEVIQTEPISLLQICESAKNRVQTGYPSFPINLKMRFEDTNLLVKGNPLLENVFINLLTNSIKYRKETQQEIEVELDAEQSEEFVIITYSDHGVGIHDELKEQVFDRFGLTRTELKGSGLGLSIVRRIVRGIGGEICATNRYDSPEDFTAGTSFTIKLLRV